MNGEPGTILVVEDNPDDVFALNWAFHKAGIEIPLQVVTDGQQALNYLSGEGMFSNREVHPLPQLILLDLKLPFYTGHEILSWIRQRPELTSISVVILSGSDESRDREAAKANGANGYLVKPVNADVLVQTLKAETAFAGLFESP